MSASPQMMAQLLASGLGSGAPQSYGGGNAGPIMQSNPNALQGAAQMAQKMMLIKALQQQPQGSLPTQAPPQYSLGTQQPNAMGGVNGMPQQMNQQPVPGGQNA